MATRLRWLGHAAIQIESDGKTILIDPFLTGNPAAEGAGIKARDFTPDAILLSHGHDDHLGDLVEIARRSGAEVASNYEIGLWLQKQGLKKVHGCQHGGTARLCGGTVRAKFTIAFHGSTLPDGHGGVTYGGNPCGFLVATPDGKTIYDAADTALFGDMSLIGEEGIDLALLPIGDTFTMGPDDALKAVKRLNPKKVVPIHYNTWPPIAQDAGAWAARVEAETPARAVVLQPGEWVEV
jgi:L-ascorbate metabolism protein UlaG (beta-lactamase superfamily)